MRSRSANQLRQAVIRAVAAAALDSLHYDPDPRSPHIAREGFAIAVLIGRLSVDEPEIAHAIGTLIGLGGKGRVWMES